MVILSLGSNLNSKFGDRVENLNLAVSYLEKEGIIINKKSSKYETPSYPNQDNPKFINMVILITTHLEPKDLMDVLIMVEKKLGRQRKNKNDPRTCDIDIIDYKNQILNCKYNEQNLDIPHAEMRNRNFVLIPLHEIFPDWKHPKTNENLTALINNLSDEERKSILKIKES